MARGDKWSAFGKWQFVPCVGHSYDGVLLAPDGTPRAAAFLTLEWAKKRNDTPEDVAAVRETPRGRGLQTDSGRFAQEAIARSHEAVDN